MGPGGHYPIRCLLCALERSLCLLVRDQCVGRRSTRKWGDRERRLFTERVYEGLMVVQTKVVAKSNELYRGVKATDLLYWI